VFLFVLFRTKIDVVHNDVRSYEFVVVHWAAYVMSDRPFTATLVRPRCVSCGAEMWLSRVGPHPTHSVTYDVCTFECKPCGQARSSTLDHWTKIEVQSPSLGMH
jgi:hypothetical protein